MKILHVVRGLANSSGTTHIVGPLAEAQARLGHRVTVFFVTKCGEQSIIPNPLLVESCEFPMTVVSRHYGWSRSFTRAIRQRAAEFDAVHIHAIWNYVTWSAMRESRRSGVPYIVAPQGSLEGWALRRSRRLKQLYAKTFEKPLFDGAACIQALTAAEAAQCQHFGIRAKTAILPNGVDLSAIDAMTGVADLRTELGIRQSDRIVLFLSRLFPKKGLDILASAWGKVIQLHKDVALVIAGQDAGTGYGDAVRRMLADSNGLHKTHFIGEVRNERKFAVLRSANLFVLPSYSEGLPVAALEAMAVGRPVVITPGCNLPEVSDNKAGWVVRPEPGDLFESISTALASPTELELRGRNARNLVEQQFTWPAIADRSIDVYRRMRGDCDAGAPPRSVVVAGQIESVGSE